MIDFFFSKIGKDPIATGKAKIKEDAKPQGKLAGFLFVYV